MVRMPAFALLPPEDGRANAVTTMGTQSGQGLVKELEGSGSF